MPIVVSYDDPALVATLAASAGKFATDESQQMQSLRTAADARAQQQLYQQAALQTQQLQAIRQRQQDQLTHETDQQQRFALDQQNQMKRMQHFAHHNPQLMQPAAGQAAAGQPPMPVDPRGPLANPQGALDLYQPSQEIDPILRIMGQTAQRHRDEEDAMLAAQQGQQGGQPGQPAMTPYQQHQVQSTQERQQYDRRRTALKDAVTILQEQLRGTTNTSERKAIEQRIQQYLDELLQLGGIGDEAAEEATEEATPEMTAEQAVQRYGSAEAARKAHENGEFTLREG